MSDSATWSDYYVTQRGRALRQHCIAEKKNIEWRAAIGTGTPIAFDDNMTGLVCYVTDVHIKKSYAIEENHLQIVRVDNKGYEHDVLMSEIGVWAKIEGEPDDKEIFYGYAYALGGYTKIPAQTSATNRKIHEITLDTHLGRATEIQMIYDDSTLFISHADLDDFSENFTMEFAALNDDLAQIRSDLSTKVNVGSAFETAVTFDAGYSAHEGGVWYRKNTSGEVTIGGSLRADSNSFVTGTRTRVGIVPVGFRPRRTETRGGVIESTHPSVMECCTVSISANGGISVGTNVPNMRFLYFEASYVAAP